MTDVQEQLDAIVAMVEQAKTKPLSGTVALPRADLLTALTALRNDLPAQLSEAKKVLLERRSLVEAARTEAERLLSDARRQSERAVDEARRTSERLLDSARQERQSLVDDASVLAEAEQDADELVADARAEVARMRAETDDYVDASLARFQALLEHTLATVGRGRDKLRQMSDSGVQQEFPDPDGDLGMPAPAAVPSAPGETIDLDALPPSSSTAPGPVDVVQAELVDENADAFAR